MELSRQEYWSGLPFPSPGGLPDSGIEPRSPAWQVDSLPTELCCCCSEGSPTPIPNFEPGFPYLKSQGGLGRGTLGSPCPGVAPEPLPPGPDSHPWCGHIWICLVFLTCLSLAPPKSLLSAPHPSTMPSLQKQDKKTKQTKPTISLPGSEYGWVAAWLLNIQVRALLLGWVLLKEIKHQCLVIRSGESADCWLTWSGDSS